MDPSDSNQASLAKAIEELGRQLELIQRELKRISSDAVKGPQQQFTDAEPNKNDAHETNKCPPRSDSGRGAFGDDAAPQPHPPVQQSKGTYEKFRNAEYWKSQISSVKFAEWLEIFGIVVLICYTTLTFLQLRAVNEANRFSERASVNIGLPNGDVANFIQDGRYLELYAKNDGTTVARQTHIEIFPETVYAGQTEVHKIPPFPGWGEIQRITGTSVPPGVTFTRFKPLDEDVLKAVKEGRAALHVYGRISYVDRFGCYCAPFSAMYSRPLDRFLLTATLVDELCDGKAHEVISMTEPEQHR